MTSSLEYCSLCAFVLPIAFKEHYSPVAHCIANNQMKDGEVKINRFFVEVEKVRVMSLVVKLKKHKF